eukprot:312529_1
MKEMENKLDEDDDNDHDHDHDNKNDDNIPPSNIQMNYQMSSTSNFNMPTPTPEDSPAIGPNNPYEQVSPTNYKFPLYKHELLSLHKIGQNDDHNMLILSDEHNDGLLWKLLLKNK